MLNNIRRESMKYVKIPYGLVLRFYGWRLFVVSFIWFIYDVSALSSTGVLPHVNKLK